MDQQRIFVPSQHTKQVDMLLVTLSLKHDLGLDPNMTEHFDLAAQIAKQRKLS